MWGYRWHVSIGKNKYQAGILTALHTFQARRVDLARISYLLEHASCEVVFVRFRWTIFLAEVWKSVLRTCACSLIKDKAHACKPTSDRTRIIGMFCLQTSRPSPLTALKKWEGERVNRLRTERHPGVRHNGRLESDGVIGCGVS